MRGPGGTIIVSKCLDFDGSVIMTRGLVLCHWVLGTCGRNGFMLIYLAPGERSEKLPFAVRREVVIRHVSNDFRDGN